MFMEQEIEALIQENFKDICIDDCILKEIVPIDVALRLWKTTRKIGIVLSPEDFLDKDIYNKNDILYMIYNSYKRRPVMKSQA